jgi:hypothetical protein
MYVGFLNVLESRDGLYVVLGNIVSSRISEKPIDYGCSGYTQRLLKHQLLKQCRS